MTCPFLEYRESSADREFDVARAYCTATNEFVQPMRADICNDRYDLAHADECEIFQAHADLLDESDERWAGGPDGGGHDGGGEGVKEEGPGTR